MGGTPGLLKRLRDAALDAELDLVNLRVNNPELDYHERLELIKRKQVLLEMKTRPLT